MSDQPTAKRRWTALFTGGLGVLALSLSLHLAALLWAGGHIGLPSPLRADPATVTVQLQPARPQVRAAAAASPPPAPVTQKLRAASPRPRKPAPPAPAVVATVPTAPAAVETMPAAEVAAVTAPVEQPAASAEPARRFRVPPPVELKYDVQSLRDGKVVYGRGKIAWRTDGGRYRIEGEAGVLFFTVLNFQSLGAIDDFGVAPEVYTEKRYRRDETITNFQRDTGRIHFSASDASYPRAGGEQDRASVVWQLAAIGLGDAARFAPGAQLELFVAGVRDAQSWVIEVIGLEQTETPAGSTAAWHVVRAPRPGSPEQKLDIWLAPQQSWYPVRLRYTETNGDYLDMAVTALEPLTPI